MSKLMISDYVRLAKATPTVEKEFEYFKENIFNRTLVWEGVKNPKAGGNLHNVAGDSGGWTLWGIAYNHNKEMFKNFDDFRDTTYEEAAAIAYVKYYRAISAFILSVLKNKQVKINMKHSNLFIFSKIFKIFFQNMTFLIDNC